jgi:hypothetical protein
MAQRCGKEAAEALKEASETATQRLAKLLQSLSVSTQSSVNIPPPVRKESNSITDVVWESAF